MPASLATAVHRWTSSCSICLACSGETLKGFRRALANRSCTSACGSTWPTALLRLARAEVRRGGCGVGEDQIDVAGQQVVEGERGALVGNHRQFDARLQLEVFRDEVAGRAVTRADGDAARRLLGPLDQGRQIVDAEIAAG